MRVNLVLALERGHGLALVLVERVADHLAIGQLDLVLLSLLPREGVFHPLLVCRWSNTGQ